MKKASKKKSSASRRAPPRLTLRHLLVPSDFSGFARQALTCAVPLARKFRARISLVHVVPSQAFMQTMPDGSIVAPLNTDKLLNAAKINLDELAARWLPEELRGQTLVREGNPAREVVAAAQALKVDLIVLSNTGHSGLRHLVLGSTAEQIVRHAHCSVLTVRRPKGGSATRMLSQEKPVYPAGLPWRRILVPLDFSLTSLRALAMAVPLAERSGARLLLLNVVEPNPYANGMDGAALVMPDTLLARNAKAHLPQVARRFVPGTVRVTSLVARGRAAEVIVETAAANGVDLIVLSTHGHTGWDRLLLGSTAEAVVRTAGCPVFVVRKPQAARPDHPQIL